MTTEVHNAMAAINRAWREGRVSEMRPHLHPDVTVVFPGFSGSITGRDALLGGFEEFCANARVLEYTETDEQIQVVGDVAVVSFRFDMLYERPAYRERSRGRDIWAFRRLEGKWVAHWRTMVELVADRQPSG